MYGPIRDVFVSDVMNCKVYKVRANHYPANVTIEIDCLEHPIGIAICNDVLYCAESKKDSIAFKDLTGETIVDVTKLKVEKLKEKLKVVDKWNEDWKRKPKKYLQEKLREVLKSIETSDPIESGNLWRFVLIMKSECMFQLHRHCICHTASFDSGQPERYSHCLSSARL